MKLWRLPAVMSSISIDEPLSHAVVEVVADAENVDPTELETPLHEVINPDALDTLFKSTADGSPRPRGKLIFEYCGHTVSVTSDATVVLADDLTDLEKTL